MSPIRRRTGRFPLPATIPPKQHGILAEAFAANAQDAVDVLREALDAAGVRVPSLGVDPWGHPGAPVQLVELGCVRPDVAVALATVIRRGVER